MALHNVTSGRGDMILRVLQSGCDVDEQYLVQYDSLRLHSDYLRAMLDPLHYKEGRELAGQLRTSTTSRASESINATSLPSIIIRDLLPSPMPSDRLLSMFSLFLSILHGARPSWPHKKNENMQNLALLACIAQRFQAMPIVKAYVESLRLGSWLSDLDSQPFKSERYHRWHLLAGIILDQQSWVRVSSGLLVTETLPEKTGLDAEVEPDEAFESAWDELPEHWREEIALRRQLVLNTFDDIQKWFLRHYSSGQTQCKRFYANSSVCDSFHLGEALRHFIHRGTLTLQTAFDANSLGRPAERSLAKINTSLRACPGYQVDQWHAHCGIRNDLLPILDAMQRQQLGICLRCWNDERDDESWGTGAQRDSWQFQPAKMVGLWRSCADHRAIRAMYTSPHRQWTQTH